MALVRHSPHELKPSANEMSTNNAEQLVLLEKSEKERPHQLPPPRREIWFILAKITLFLSLAILYTIFCFIVHYRHVPISQSGVLGPQSFRFSTVSAITTVTILIVYVMLWPIKGTVDEIRAEEFFRLMDTHLNGVPLGSVNAVSATTTGAFDIFMATIYCRCSPLLTSTLVISLAITATSSIAPATLSVGSIWIDVDNSTLWIGALPKDSFLVDTSNSGFLNYSPMTVFPWSMASTMAWVEDALNLTNSYYKVTSSEGNQFEYLVPFPPGFTSTKKADWTTDVIVLDPSCSWQTATTTGHRDSIWDVTLLNSNWGINVGTAASGSDVMYEFLSDRFGRSRISALESYNTTVAVDGSVIFVLDQLIYLDSRDAWPGSTIVNLASIPTLKFNADNFTVNVLAFLQCSPHISIQTRQVLATGNGNLTLGKHKPSQGNIDFYQANYILSFILQLLPTDSGPTTVPSQMGTDLMAKFIFGTNVHDAYSNVPRTPARLTDITAMYKQVIHSAMKIVMSGAFAVESVPGGYAREQIVFTSSLGHVVISAILFGFLAIALVAAQFRKGRVAFTLVNVAAALADSDVPQKSVEMAQFTGAGGRKVLKLVPGGDGQLYCVYEP